MDKFRQYDVVFSGLKNGEHRFNFEIEQIFFNLFEMEQEFSKSRVLAHVLLNKHSTFLEFSIKIGGWVELVCDVSNKAYDYQLENNMSFLVNFSDTYDDSNDEVINIPRNSHAYNLAQNIYELTVLAIPMKKLALEVDIESEINNYTEQPKTNEEIDPRWAVLKNIKFK